MKKILLIALVAAVGATVTSCDDFLNDNRYPMTSIVNSPEYWNSTNNCQLQVDRYIDEINPGYGSGNTLGWFQFKTLNDDQVGSSFADWNYTSVPATNGSWSYVQVRGANIIIDGVTKAAKLSASDRANYLGIARFIRAVAYYKLCRTFGDVVWEDQPMDVNSPELYGPRSPRDEIMDKVFDDLQFAVANIKTDAAKLTWSKDFAKAYLCEVALYEGTFCKYRTAEDNGAGPNMERSKKYLKIAADMGEQLLAKYGFADDYHSIYNSVWGGGESDVAAFKGEKITDFTKNPEIIFGRRYDVVNGRHSTIAYTCSSTTTSGMSADGFKAFLMLDGTVAPSTPELGENTTDNGAKAYSIAALLAARDKRLSVITDPYVYYKGMEWARAKASGMNASAGLGVAKYDNVLLPVTNRANTTQNYTSCPIYWTSYIACNYAEAKQELGEFDDAAFQKSIGHLYKRAGLPFTRVSQLASVNDPKAAEQGISSTLFEIRRCRRCELMFDNWIRYWDLIRWHQLDLLDSQKHPDVLRGAYVPNADKQPATSQDGYVRPYPSTDRIYAAKYYLDPIPSGQLNLNPELGQNRGW